MSTSISSKSTKFHQSHNSSSSNKKSTISSFSKNSEHSFSTKSHNNNHKLNTSFNNKKHNQSSDELDDDDDEDNSSDSEQDEDSLNDNNDHDNNEGNENSTEQSSDDDDDNDDDNEENNSTSSSSSSHHKPTPTTTTTLTSSSSSSSSSTAPVTFNSLGVCDTLAEACQSVGWKYPTKIQQEAIPQALKGQDIIGLAETGSGKTGAFALPILQSLLTDNQRIYALVLAPTRELAFQISEQFEALGSSIGLKTAVIVGGIDMMAQAVSLARKPHIIVGTPGRIVDHLQNTKGFSLRSIKYLVMDEADRMLSLDFEEALNTILASLSRDRHTYLFSATMTSKVAKLQRASLQNPVRVEVSSRYQTVSTLVQQYLFIPAKFKECYLVYVLNEFAGQSGIVFTSTCANAQKISLMLNNLGFKAVSLHGQMSQPKRLHALNKFKSGSRNILIATDVASRGLDIPTVDLVLNYDIPTNGKEYIHRVGRTARAGRAGRAITYVTQYDIELYQRIEALIGQKLEAFPAVEEAAIILAPRVTEALRLASIELREKDDDEEKAGLKRKSFHNENSNDTELNEDNAAAAIVEDSMRKRQMIAQGIRKKGKMMGRNNGGGGGKRR